MPGGMILRIVIYALGICLFEVLCMESVGAAWLLLPAIFLLAILVFSMVKNPGFPVLGAHPTGPLPARKALFCLPLMVVATARLWGGVTMRFDPKTTLVFMVTLFCVGCVQEILFSGLLVRILMEAMPAQKAVLVCGLAFGAGHIINVTSAAGPAAILLQCVYGAAMGVMLANFVLHTGHLRPCCLCQGVFYALSAFAGSQPLPRQAAVCVVLVILSLGYFFWLNKAIPLSGLLSGNTKETGR